MNQLRSLLFSALAVCTLISAPVVHAADPAPINLSFQKTLNFSTGIWTGTVQGDLGPGIVVYHDIGTSVGTKVQHFSGEYVISAGGHSVTATVSGIVNYQTSDIVLNGVVTGGPYTGSRFNVRAKLILTFDEAGNVTSVGTAGEMTITPSH
ncbi:MAG: hypothetical protein ABIV50_00390 [Opitutus sp.]